MGLNSIKHGRFGKSIRSKLDRAGDFEAVRAFDAVHRVTLRRLKPSNAFELARAKNLAREAWSEWWHANRGGKSPVVAGKIGTIMLRRIPAHPAKN